MVGGTGLVFSGTSARCGVAGKLATGQLGAVLDHALAGRGGLWGVFARGAGLAGMGAAADITAAHWDRTFAINARGVFLFTKYAIPHMIEAGGGSIINISSAFGIVAGPHFAAYAASKGAVRNFSKSTALDYIGQGIRCNSIHPGYIDTPLTQKNRYRMPFLMPPEKFADRAFRAIQANVSYRVIPWQMGWLAKILRMLPNAVLDRLLAGRPRKRRSDGT